MSQHHLQIIIVTVIISTLIFTISIFFLITRLEKKTNIVDLQFTYYGEVVTPVMVKAHNIKDPEFFRIANHSIFRDEEGYYYVIVTAHLFPAILKTRDFKTYELVSTINLVGKVAPYVIYDPQENKFYLFYSDWLNTIQGDIRYARLGLAVGNYSKDIASIKFEDQGYLNIDNSPLIDPSAGWDPYIIKINETYFMLFSSAIHGVHLASAQKLGREWKYIGTIIYENRENPALFQYNNTWYMLIGIYDAPGYDLYSSKNFLEWKLVKRNWFRDPEYPVLPAGSTCVLLNGTLYHLYQVPLDADYISGRFSLKLAYTVLEP
ncbi:MAG: hypothetical protein QXX99_07150 [Candidatus Bathyarchaeia archaeon]